MDLNRAMSHLLMNSGKHRESKKSDVNKIAVWSKLFLLKNNPSSLPQLFSLRDPKQSCKDVNYTFSIIIKCFELCSEG